jgi:hypothetical protein
VGVVRGALRRRARTRRRRRRASSRGNGSVGRSPTSRPRTSQ